MVEALLFAFSVGTLLSYLDAKVIPAPDGHRSNTESYRIQKRSSINTNEVSIWLERAKKNTDSTMEALEKSSAPSWLQGELKEAKDALDKVNITSAKSLLNDLWKALFLAARELYDILSEYKNTQSGDPMLLNAMYYATGACIDLMFALWEALIDSTLRATVFEKIEALQNEPPSTPGETMFSNRTLELVTEVLQETKNHNYVQNTV